MASRRLRRRRRRHPGHRAASSPGTTPTPGDEVVLTGRDAGTSPRPRRRDRRRNDRAWPSTSPSPRTIAAALADVGPVRYLVMVAIDRDENTVARLRHRHGRSAS